MEKCVSCTEQNIPTLLKVITSAAQGIQDHIQLLTIIDPAIAADTKKDITALINALTKKNLSTTKRDHNNNNLRAHNCCMVEGVVIDAMRMRIQLLQTCVSGLPSDDCAIAKIMEGKREGGYADVLQRVVETLSLLSHPQSSSISNGTCQGENNNTGNHENENSGLLSRVMLGLENLGRTERLHERVLRALDKFVSVSSHDGVVKDIDDLLEAARSAESPGVSGNVSKFGADLAAITNCGLQCRNLEDVLTTPPQYVNVYDAVRGIGMNSLHRYRICTLGGCHIITSNCEKHLASHHKEECPIGDTSSVFKVPTVNDIIVKMRDFWNRFQSKFGMNDDGRSPHEDYLGHLHLTEDDVCALYVYTLETEIYGDMNWGLREDNADVLHRYKGYMHYLLRAMGKLPRHNLKDSQLYRGIDLDLEHAYAGAAFVRWHAFSSTTASPLVVADFVKSSGMTGKPPTGTVFLVRSRHGVYLQDFSEFPKESEVLLPPNTLLRVTQKLQDTTKELLQSYIGFDLSCVFMVGLEDATEDEMIQHEASLRDEIRNIEIMLQSLSKDAEYISIVTHKLKSMDAKVLREMSADAAQPHFLYHPDLLPLLPSTTSVLQRVLSLPLPDADKGTVRIFLETIVHKLKGMSPPQFDKLDLHAIQPHYLHESNILSFWPNTPSVLQHVLSLPLPSVDDIKHQFVAFLVQRIKSLPSEQFLELRVEKIQPQLAHHPDIESFWPNSCLEHEKFLLDLCASCSDLEMREVVRGKLSEAHVKAAELLEQVESSTPMWNQGKKLTFESLARVSGLVVSNRELCTPTDKPQFMNIIALKQLLLELKQNPNKTRVVSFTATIDNALTRIESMEQLLRQSQLDGQDLGVVSLAVWKALEDCMNVPVIQREFMGVEDRIIAQLRLVEECSGEEHLGKVELLEGLAGLVRDKLNIISRVEVKNKEFDSIHEVQKKVLNDVMNLKDARKQLKCQCEKDLERLQVAIQKSELEDSEAANRFASQKEWSTAYLHKNLEEQDEAWQNALPSKVQELGLARFEEVKHRIELHDVEEIRKAEHVRFLNAASHHCSLLELTINNYDLALRCIEYVEEMVVEACHAVKVRHDKLNLEIDELRLETHKEYLDAFRDLYKTLTVHETSGTIEANVVMLKKSAALDQFNPTAEALKLAGVEFVHPMDEVNMDV